MDKYEKLRRQASIPAGLRELTDDGFRRLRDKHQRTAGPTGLSMDERVGYYAQHVQSLPDAHSVPEVRTSLPKSDAAGLASQIDSGLTLVELADSSDKLVKPILYYYGLSQICSAACSAFLQWRKFKPHHGIRIDIEKSRVSFAGRGSFQRLSATLFAVNKDPNPWVPLLFEPDEPASHRSLGLVEQLQFHEVLELRDDPARIEKWLHDRDVLGDDPDHQLRRRAIGTTRFLLNYVVLFYASWLARYSPKTWRKMLDGKKSTDILSVEAAYDATQNMVNAIINMLRAPGAVAVAHWSLLDWKDKG